MSRAGTEPARSGRGWQWTTFLAVTGAMTGVLGWAVASAVLLVVAVVFFSIYGHGARFGEGGAGGAWLETFRLGWGASAAVCTVLFVGGGSLLRLGLGYPFRRSAVPPLSRYCRLVFTVDCLFCLTLLLWAVGIAGLDHLARRYMPDMQLIRGDRPLFAARVITGGLLGVTGMAAAVLFLLRARAAISAGVLTVILTCLSIALVLAGGMEGDVVSLVLTVLHAMLCIGWLIVYVQAMRQFVRWEQENRETE